MNRKFEASRSGDLPPGCAGFFLAVVSPEEMDKVIEKSRTVRLPGN
jgi:hypothetical protein